ncbi:hypothetical protein LJR235_000053 [Pararhizobium sp. LjRoot235]|uniref:hypothetical protein n=1 Tax=Pararhizobium sp. LjRoot235 TaxID=3342291 RepID=UPI003ECF32B6
MAMAAAVGSGYVAGINPFGRFQMLAQFLAITLINTFTWFGGQGYCAYDFAVLGNGEELTDISLTLRPQFDPQNTATGNTELPDETISFDTLGGSADNAGNTAKIETDCNVEGFDIVAATGTADGEALDLVATGRVEIDTYKPLTLKIGE